MLVVDVLYCSTCEQEEEFEQPPCADGHGADCPELACVACGTAVVTGPPPVALAPPELARSA